MNATLWHPAPAAARAIAQLARLRRRRLELEVERQLLVAPFEQIRNLRIAGVHHADVGKAARGPLRMRERRRVDEVAGRLREGTVQRDEVGALEQRLQEIRASVDAGAQEIDVVITRGHVLIGDWRALYDEVRAFRDAAGPAHVKTILATGELATLTNVARASLVCMMAGADFVKTSTGKEGVNATLPVGLDVAAIIEPAIPRL